MQYLLLPLTVVPSGFCYFPLVRLPKEKPLHGINREVFSYSKQLLNIYIIILKAVETAYRP